MRRIKVTDSEIIHAANNTSSATAAAASLGIKYETYKRYATILGVFVKNQSGKGISKPIEDSRKMSLYDILEGKYPQYQSNKLRLRLIKENVKEEKCESCGNMEWMGKKIPLELDHIDGNCYNHMIDNLRLLCPNCHAFTENYRGKNIKRSCN
jgi:hypothetical protein